MLRPILLLLASHEAAQVYSITTDGGVLNGEIAVHAWGHGFELARDLKRYENSLAHDECEEDHLSKIMGRVIRAMGHSHNKLLGSPVLHIEQLTDPSVQAHIHNGHSCPDRMHLQHSTGWQPLWTGGPDGVYPHCSICSSGRLR